MNTAVVNARVCPACREAELVEAIREKHFNPLGKPVTVLLRVSRCPACGMELINAEQRRENLQRLRDRKADYGHLLMGEEIVALRKKYGLTQQMAARIFGKGLIAFSRYENEATYPDATTTKLLKQAIARPDMLKALADEEGVEIPLWDARCEDAARAKRAVIRPLPFSPDSLDAWRKLRAEQDVHRPHGWFVTPGHKRTQTQHLYLQATAVNDDAAAGISVS